MELLCHFHALTFYRLRYIMGLIPQQVQIGTQTYNTIMINKLLAITALFFIICSCAFVRKDTGHALSSVELFCSIQVIKADNGKLFDFKSNFIICSKGNYIVYKCPVLHFITKAVMNKGQDTITEEEVSRDTTYRYIINKRDSKYGYLYDSVNALKPKRIVIDSFKAVNMLGPFPLYKEGHQVLISSQTNKTSPVLIEKRKMNKEPDDTTPDTCFYYYTKRLQHVPYTFVAALDSTRKLKLYKIIFLFNFIKKGEHPFDVPEHRYTFELKEARPSPEVPGLIDRFKNTEGNDF
jgi:hypothetical protein